MQHKYVGSYKKGKKSGNGKYELKSGWAYIGIWEDGFLHGSCVFENNFNFSDIILINGPQQGMGTNNFSTEEIQIEKKVNQTISIVSIEEQNNQLVPIEKQVNEEIPIKVTPFERQINRNEFFKNMSQIKKENIIYLDVLDEIETLYKLSFSPVKL